MFTCCLRFIVRWCITCSMSVHCSWVEVLMEWPHIGLCLSMHVFCCLLLLCVCMQAVCYNGQCETHDLQCKEIWGESKTTLCVVLICYHIFINLLSVSFYFD